MHFWLPWTNSQDFKGCSVTVRAFRRVPECSLSCKLIKSNAYAVDALSDAGR